MGLCFGREFLSCDGMRQILESREGRERQTEGLVKLVGARSTKSK